MTRQLTYSLKHVSHGWARVSIAHYELIFSSTTVVSDAGSCARPQLWWRRLGAEVGLSVPAMAAATQASLKKIEAIWASLNL